MCACVYVCVYFRLFLFACFQFFIGNFSRVACSNPICTIYCYLFICFNHYYHSLRILLCFRLRRFADFPIFTSMKVAANALLAEKVCMRFGHRLNIIMLQYIILQ